MPERIRARETATTAQVKWTRALADRKPRAAPGSCPASFMQLSSRGREDRVPIVRNVDVDIIQTKPTTVKLVVVVSSLLLERLR